jgi:hypothetical protein
MQRRSQFAIGPVEMQYLGVAVTGVAMVGAAVQGVAVASILVPGVAASALPAERSMQHWCGDRLSFQKSIR